MIVSKKKPRGKILFLPTKEGNSKNAIKLEGDNKFKSSKTVNFFSKINVNLETNADMFMKKNMFHQDSNTIQEIK